MALAAKQQDEELESIVNARNSLEKENLDQQFKQATQQIAVKQEQQK